MPERPFVPRRTPTRAQPAFGDADFKLSKPFVPGVEGQRAEPVRAEINTGRERPQQQAVRSIDEFLDFATGTVSDAGREEEDETFREPSAEDEELPPVEHFVDPLPPVGDFAAETTDREGDVGSPINAASGPGQTEWLETDWQQYDWRAIAALADSGEKEASSAWAETDWDANLPRTREAKPTAAQAIATALDQIAQKIREGELALPGPGTVTDPRTIATTLAALLGIRQ